MKPTQFPTMTHSDFMKLLQTVKWTYPDAPPANPWIDSDIPTTCTREQPHTGPCNGWPHLVQREIPTTQAVAKAPLTGNGSWTMVLDQEPFRGFPFNEGWS